MRLTILVAASSLALSSPGAAEPAQGAAGGSGSSAAQPDKPVQAQKPAPPQGQPPQAQKASPQAGALARALLPPEQWDKILDRYALSLSSQVSEALSRQGEKVPDDLRGSVRKELGDRLPYQQTVDAQAQALTKEFSADEMKRAADFYSSALGKKVLDKLPDAQTEVAEQLQEKLSTAVPEIVQRLAPKALPNQEAAPGESAKPPPAVQGRKPPASGPSGPAGPDAH